MKKIVSMLCLLIVAGTMSAQPPKGKAPMGEGSSVKTHTAQRKFQILVENEKNAKKVQDTNERLLSLQESTRGDAERSLLLVDLLWTGVTSAFKQKTVNATSNLVSMGMNYVSEALKSKREKWHRRAEQQCYYHQTLSTENQINDFYALPSNKGPMDPENLKFEGFGCKNYIEVGNSKEGVGVFYIFCKIRRDSVGLRHIVNHSKFLVEIDSLVINPRYCNLPNDSSGSVESRFSFEKRDNLNLQLNARLYSSWINQATMITNDQLLGEFTVNVEVDKNKLNSEGLFIYDKNDPDFQNLVSVDGDSYIVPRSYTGTSDGVNYQPTWGTGQYRIEMEVSEQCTIVDSYYQIQESGNGEAVAFADATPGKKKWDKAKWKVEWKAMNARRKGTPFWKNAWNCVVSAYKGTGWMATLTDPITTALYSWETQELGDWIDDMHEKVFDDNNASSPSSNKSAGAASASSTPTTNAPSGNQGGKPSGAPNGGQKPSM